MSAVAASFVAVDLLISKEEVGEERFRKQAKRPGAIVGVLSGDQVVPKEINDHLRPKYFGLLEIQRTTDLESWERSGDRE